MADRLSSEIIAFYKTEGQRLVDPDNYPTDLRDYVSAERQVLRATLDAAGYDFVIEVGCMNGCLHFEEIVATNTRYLGIDLNADSIEQFQEKLTTSPRSFGLAEAHALDVCKLASMADKTSGKVVVDFPFNAFGNLGDPASALCEVAKCGFDALVFTYRTDPRSSSRRREYYARCGYTNLQMVSSDKGIGFVSDEGLCTWAYETEWLVSHSKATGFDVEIADVGKIGLVYWLQQKNRER